mmetsp:Transcript_23395/g.53991  ORF Transcript_23395/g.53991 Transcript_23395/m.53991 type:complete len:649 (-) Transcript_23395:63-2009(-)
MSADDPFAQLHVLLHGGQRPGTHSSAKDGVLPQDVLKLVEFEKKEDEVRMAEIESRTRSMILEVLKPTIQKTTRLQYDHEEMSRKYADLSDKFKEMVRRHEEAKQQWDLLLLFKEELEGYLDQIKELEGKVQEHQKSMLNRIVDVEQSCDLQKSACQRLTRSSERMSQEIEKLHKDLKTSETALEGRIHRNKDHATAEFSKLGVEITDLQRNLTNGIAEIWGNEESDSKRPSLWRLDWELKQAKEKLSTAVENISDLQRLDGEMSALTDRQTQVESFLGGVRDTSDALKERVEEIAVQTKDDFTRFSNMSAVSTANLLRSARENFRDELKESQKLRQNVEDFMTQTRGSIQDFGTTVGVNTRQVEAIIREVRTDLEALDGKRRKDKQGLEEEIHMLQARSNSTEESTEAVLKGVEHVTSILGMMLQGERIAVALQLQDFMERQETPYVGVKDQVVNRNESVRQSPRRGGLDPAWLYRLAYQPRAVKFQGMTLERPQLLALREKFVNAAQGILSNGPPKEGGQAGLRLSPPSSGASATQVLGHAAELPTGMKTEVRQLCQGACGYSSRGQTSSRGTPPLELQSDGRQSATPDSLGMPLLPGIGGAVGGVRTLPSLTPGSTRPSTTQAPMRQGPSATEGGAFDLVMGSTQ